ncbi:MAG: hypothetical protein GY862_31260 [Gammaproteobacteria bacterium]|nr:hypothetical protein [Gammaproteobacteria bacterium]
MGQLVESINRLLLSIYEKIGAEERTRQLSTRNEQLAKAKEVADAANRAKGAFLAGMSHEIRTPMNAITGLTRLAMKTELTDKQRNYLEQIDSSSHALLGVINDILDFSKIEAGMLDMESIDFHLDDVLDNLSTLLGTRIEEKGLKLILATGADVPRSLTGAPLRMNRSVISGSNRSVGARQKAFRPHAPRIPQVRQIKHSAIPRLRQILKPTLAVCRT